MENNNTKDIAYIGCDMHGGLVTKRMGKENMFNYPNLISLFISLTAVFDCNGCRYGFRVKQLK